MINKRHQKQLPVDKISRSVCHTSVQVIFTNIFENENMETRIYKEPIRVRFSLLIEQHSSQDIYYTDKMISLVKGLTIFLTVCFYITSGKIISID